MKRKIRAIAMVCMAILLFIGQLLPVMTMAASYTWTQDSFYGGIGTEDQWYTAEHDVSGDTAQPGWIWYYSTDAGVILDRVDDGVGVLQLGGDASYDEATQADFADGTAHGVDFSDVDGKVQLATGRMFQRHYFQDKIINEPPDPNDASFTNEDHGVAFDNFSFVSSFLITINSHGFL